MLIAGAVIGLQLMSVFVLVFAFATAAVTRTTLIEALGYTWAARIIAAIPAGAIFVLVVAVWILLVFALPMQFDRLEDAVSRLQPQGD
jgi:hypothetical protein